MTTRDRTKSRSPTPARI
jgi:hypothetical protein